MAGVNELAHIVQLTGLVGIVLGAGFCLVAGDRPVSSAAAFYLLATIGSLVGQARQGGMAYGIMLIDIAYLVVLLAIAARWRRQWTLWAIALQSLNVVTHAAYLMGSVHPAQYLTLLALWSYLVMVAMCVGAGMAWQRRRSDSYAKVERRSGRYARAQAKLPSHKTDDIPANLDQ